MFSVVIPVGPGRDWNNAAASLSSAGLLPEDEVIVVGDGFVPETATTKVGSEIITVIGTESARGAPVARNLGAKYAKGDILCFLDSDDAYLPGVFPRIRQAILANINTDAWALGWVFRSKRQTRSDFRPPVLLEKHIWRRNMAGGASCLIVRRPVFEEVGGFDGGFPAMQDWDLWLRLCRNHKVATLPFQGVCYDDLSKNRISVNTVAREHGLRMLLAKHGLNWPSQVVAFHRARLAALAFEKGAGRWSSVFQSGAPFASIGFLLRSVVKKLRRG